MMRNLSNVPTGDEILYIRKTLDIFHDTFVFKVRVTMGILQKFNKLSQIIYKFCHTNGKRLIEHKTKTRPAYVKTLHTAT